VWFKAGDVIVPMDQEKNRYLIEVLEPESEDSFFAWNFFDTILQTKEGYSAYVFEDLAAEFLDQNPEIRKELELAKSQNPELANSGAAQLRWVYEHSPWKEKEHNRYPVYRIEY
jgi:replication initiation and membrane attachment protein DnaB